MKKIFSLFTAALLSVSMFASRDDVPKDDVLADYYEKGQLCVCVYFEEEVCNPIVWAGTYNSWGTEPTEMIKFQEVENYDGWWVVAVDDSTDPSSGDGIQGKPVQLKKDGSFSWDYQTGDPESWTLIRGSVNIKEGNADEADLKNWSTDAPNVLISDYFKLHNSPCGEEKPKHDYKIILNAPLCADAEGNFFAPAIIGDFNGWKEGVTMDVNTETLNYEYTINDEEGHAFKFKALGDTDWSNEIRIQDEGGNWINNPNIKLPVATKDTTLEIDYSAGTYTKCVGEKPDTLESVVVTLKAPAFCAELATYADSVQIVGQFDEWSGTPMTKGENNTYTITLSKVITGLGYKFKAGTGWDVEILDANGEAFKDFTFNKGETEVSHDYSVGYYWKGCPAPTAIPEVKAAKSVAKKVMVDGKMMIMVGETKFNVLGTEMK